MNDDLHGLPASGNQSERTSSGSVPDQGLGSPLDLFGRWLGDAHCAEGAYPNAATLSTVNAAGWPEARIVLIKDHGPEGLSFFTNYQSPKAEALALHPRAELCFYWKTLGRQVRVRGTVARLSEQASDTYFAGRDRASQIGAWASDQSQACPDPEILAERCAAVAVRFVGQVVPRPPNWGGFTLSPLRWEFWEEGRSRLHRRDLFTLEDNGWTRAMLFP
jgi:pyridoxamine 5'-phosphate oxidase